MNTSDICQLTGMQIDFGRLTLADGRLIDFITMALGYLHQGSQHSAPALTLSPDQARTLAQALLAAADKATTTDRSAPRH